MSTPNNKKQRVEAPKESTQELATVSELDKVIQQDTAVSYSIKLVDAPANYKSTWWKYYSIYCPKAHKDKKDVAVCKICKKEINVKNTRKGLQTHVKLHKDKLDTIATELDEQRKLNRNNLVAKLKAVPLGSTEHQNQNFIDSAVAWVVEENLPLNATSKPSFRRMIESIKPNAPKLSAQRIRDEIEHIGSICKKSIRKELFGKYIALTTDHWTSRNDDNYSCLTAHWVDNDNGNLKCAVLHFEVHEGTTAGDRIGEQFIEMFNSYELDLKFITAVVTDTTGNMNTFGQYLHARGVIHLYCVDHNLHLCAKMAFNDANLPDSSNVMKTAREVIEYFTKSTQAMSKLMNQQRALNPDKIPLKLLQDVRTRWWSTWRMLHRLRTLDRYINALIASHEVHLNHVLTVDQKSILFEVEQLLEPLAQAQRMLEGENYTTLSIVPYALWKIRNQLSRYANEENVSESTKHLARKMLVDFTDKRYGDLHHMFHEEVIIGRMNRYISLHPIVLAATALDPRMKKLEPFIASEQEREDVWEYTKQLFVEHAMEINITIANVDPAEQPMNNENDIAPEGQQGENYTNFFSELLEAHSTMQQHQLGHQNDNGNDRRHQRQVELICAAEWSLYKQMNATNFRTDPLKWWNDNKFQMPNLCRFAFKLLSIPATSAPSERLWSIAARILVKDRARLSSELVSSLLFIKENGAILKKHIEDIEGRKRVLPTVYEEDMDNYFQELINQYGLNDEDDDK
jgi:hypothetical protein